MPVVSSAEQVEVRDDEKLEDFEDVDDEDDDDDEDLKNQQNRLDEEAKDGANFEAVAKEKLQARSRVKYSSNLKMMAKYLEKYGYDEMIANGQPRISSLTVTVVKEFFGALTSAQTVGIQHPVFGVPHHKSILRMGSRLLSDL